MIANIELSKLLKKASTDAAFRAALLKDPKAALREAFELEVPGAKVTVLEDSEKVVHLVIPLPPDGEAEDPNGVVYWP